jgi:hypothetical protein
MNKISKVFLTICISVLGVLASSCDQHVASKYGVLHADYEQYEDAAIIEISGKVVNVKKEALENIKVVYVNRQELAVFTDKDGFFVLRFSQSLETQMNLEKNIIVSDPDEIYAKKEVTIELLCHNSKDPGYEYECKNDQTEKETVIILEKQLPQV